MHKTGNTPPIRIKNKDKWIGLERLRWASAFAVPMMTDMPPDFPALTLPVMRALCALAPEAEDPAGQERLVRALDVLFPAYWVEGRRTHDLGVLREVLGGVFGGEEAERCKSSLGSFLRLSFPFPSLLSGHRQGYIRGIR